MNDACLENVNLSDADLRGAFLRRVNLGGADLSGADIRNVIMNGAILCNTTMPDGDVEYSGCLPSVSYSDCR